MVQLVIVHQGVEAVFLAVPEMPEEGAAVEEGAVLGEEVIPQPVLQAGFAGALAFEAGLLNEVALVVAAQGGGEQGAQTGGGGLFPVQGRQADDAVSICQRFQPIRAEGRAIGKTGTGLARPLIAEQARHGHVQWLVRARRVAVEQPLRRVAGKRLRQAIGIFLSGDFLPVGEVEGDFFERRVGRKDLLVDFPHSGRECA